VNEPSLEERERLRRLEKACVFVLNLCDAVEHDWTRLEQLQEQLPSLASTMNKAMLAVIGIATESSDVEPAEEVCL
jgi:predicted GTPase